MQAEFFGRQVERLRRVYSPTSLNEERVKVLWENFKSIPNAQFEAAVNTLIGEFTTTALPGVSRFREAVANSSQRVGTQMQELRSGLNCENCRDFGYFFRGDTVTKCPLCAAGRMVTPEEIKKQQENYERGAKFMRGGFKNLFPALPYDPKQRGELPPFDQGEERSGGER